MTEKVSLRRADASEEDRRAAAALMGRAKTPEKIAASLRNLEARSPEEMGGRAPVPLAEIRCTCAAGEDLTGHHWSCPRGQAVKRRQKQGKDPHTGEKLGGSK